MISRSELDFALVATGTELIFLIVDGMVLCFGFRRETAGYTVMFELLLSSAAQRQECFRFSASRTVLPVRGLQGTKSWEGREPEQLT